MLISKEGETMEFGDKKAPDLVVESAIVLQKQIFQAVGLKDAISRAYAIHYFKETYNENEKNPYHHTFRAVAALHLASKVCEDAKILARFVSALDECKKKENLSQAFAVLGQVNDIGKDFVPYVTSELRSYELDLIQDLKFNFQVKLPYDYVPEFVTTVVHWHVSTRYALYKEIREKIIRNCTTFLNDLQMTPIFYNYKPKVVAQASVRLSFVLMHLKVPNPNKTPWYSYLVPEEKIEVLDECTNKIQKYFESRGIIIEKLEAPMFPENSLNQWYIRPIEDYRGKEPPCEPPPKELLQSFTGQKDAFNNLWTDHAPILPPPDCEEYQDSIRIAIECEKKGDLIVSQKQNGNKRDNGRFFPSHDSNGKKVDLRVMLLENAITKDLPRSYAAYDSRTEHYREQSLYERPPKPNYDYRMPPPPPPKLIYDRRTPVQQDYYDRRPPLPSSSSNSQPIGKVPDYYDRPPPKGSYDRPPPLPISKDAYDRISQKDTYERLPPKDFYDRSVSSSKDSYDRTSSSSKDSYDRLPPSKDSYDRGAYDYDRLPMPPLPRDLYEKVPQPTFKDLYDRTPPPPLKDSYDRLPSQTKIERRPSIDYRNDIPDDTRRMPPSVRTPVRTPRDDYRPPPPSYRDNPRPKPLPQYDRDRDWDRDAMMRTREERYLKEERSFIRDGRSSFLNDDPYIRRPPIDIDRQRIQDVSHQPYKRIVIDDYRPHPSDYRRNDDRN